MLALLRGAVDFCDHHSGFLLALLTAIYVIATLLLVVQSYQQTRLAVRLERERTRPYLTFDIVAHGPAFEGILTNDGLTAAVDVRLKLQPDIRVELGGRERGLNMATRTITLLPPRKSIDEYLGNFEELKLQNDSMRFLAQLSYKDSTRQRSYGDDFEIDLSFGEEHAFISKPVAAEEFKNLNENIRELARALLKAVKPS